MELDKEIFKETTNIFDESIYILHYPKYGNEQKVAVSYGILKGINEFNINQVINIDKMFKGCNNLNKLDLSKFNINS